MKRNLLLLTAVVLAVVLLSGCILPWQALKVSYDLDGVEEVFNEDKLIEKVKKNSLVDLELVFAEEDSGFDADSFVYLVKAGDDNVEFEANDLVEEEKVVGVKLSIPESGKVALKVTVNFSLAE